MVMDAVSRLIFAPRAERQRIVASMSSDVPESLILTGLSPRAAHISIRWTWDLEGMAGMTPDKVEGVMVISFMSIT